MDRLILVTSPSDDAEFRAAAERLVATVASPEELTRHLRSTYPRALARRRELSGEPIETWYVYRDGRWTPRRGSQPTEEHVDE